MGYIKGSEGAAQQMADTMESGLGGSFRTLKSAVEGLAISFGERLAPTNTEKGELEMCEKVDQLVKQTRLTDLFVYTERGLMTLKNAAVAAELTPKEFRTQMQMNGYTVPQKTRKSPSSSVE